VLAGVRQGDIEFFQTDIGDGVKLIMAVKPPDFDLPGGTPSCSMSMRLGPDSDGLIRR
jgi:hypothetical protein